MPKSTYMGQVVLFQTSLFGKSYFWMQDGDEIIYLVKEIDGKPSFI